MSLKEDFNLLQARHKELSEKWELLSLENQRLEKELAAMKAQEGQMSRSEELQRRIISMKISFGDFRFQLADYVTEEMLSVMIGAQDMSEARNHLRHWWNDQVASGFITEEGPYPFGKESLNLVEYSRKISDKVRGIAEAFSQEIRTLSLQRHSG